MGRSSRLTRGAETGPSLQLQLYLFSLEKRPFKYCSFIEAVVLGDGGQNHVKTVEILVKAGADKTIPDRDGVTPLQHAMERGYEEMVMLLK